MTLLFDIETKGKKPHELPDFIRETLTKGVKPEEHEATLERTALSPYTGEVVCIGCKDTERNKSLVLLACDLEKDQLPDDPKVIYKALGSEEAVLSYFWDVCSRQKSWMSFNGRTFDVPFLVVRSAVYGLTPWKALVRAKRYDLHVHNDLKEYVENFGAMRTRFNFEMLCHTIGVPSPKTNMHGGDVGLAWDEGRYVDVGHYCNLDVDALHGCGIKLGFLEPPKQEEPVAAAEPAPPVQTGPPVPEAVKAGLAHMEGDDVVLNAGTSLPAS